MTANPFAALLDGVPRYTVKANWITPVSDGDLVRLSDVLAALAAAYPADLAEAGEVLEGVTAGPWSIPGQPDKICAEGYTKNGFARTIATVATPSWMGSAEPWANASFIAWCREGVPALLARLAAQRSAAAWYEQLNRHNSRRAEAAETALAAERAKVAKLVEYYEASEAILSIEAEWRSRKADGLLDGSNIFNLTDKLTAAEARLAKARAAITEERQ